MHLVFAALFINWHTQYFHGKKKISLFFTSPPQINFLILIKMNFQPFFFYHRLTQKQKEVKISNSVFQYYSITLTQQLHTKCRTAQTFSRTKLDNYINKKKKSKRKKIKIYYFM